MSQVGFIGAGNIGAPMARSLLRGKIELKLCDSSETVRRRFEDLGCETTDEAGGLGRCRAIVIMVNTADQLKAALFGRNGLVSGLEGDIRPLIIVTSTILPAIVDEVSRTLASHGLAMIDAPVSGGPIPASEGKLTIMVGGEPADIESASPILHLLGDRVIVCGALGAGQKAKIINNLVGVTNQLIMAEALALGVRCGLSGACLLSVMDNSSGRNFWSRDWALTRAQYAEYAEVAEQDLLLQRSAKDLELARRLAEAADIDLPLVEIVADATGRMKNSDLAERFRGFV